MTHWLCKNFSSIPQTEIQLTEKDYIHKKIQQIWQYTSTTNDERDFTVNSKDTFDLPEGIEIIHPPLNNVPTSTSGIVAKCTSHHTLFISFRGSQETTDWKRNFLLMKKVPYKLDGFNQKKNILCRLFPKLCKEPEVHEGFYGDYTSVRAQILEKVDAHLKKYPQSKIYITGHSLGAALAYICSVDLYYARAMKNICLLTFGSPRPGNEIFSTSLDKKIEIRRVVNNRDIVCRIPLKIQGYHSYIIECLFTQDYEFHINTDNAPSFQRISALEDLQKELLLIEQNGIENLQLFKETLQKSNLLDVGADIIDIPSINDHLRASYKQAIFHNDLP
ncbi:MAG: lipase family protein [Candidatus Heimdallarchaeota archaeon]|nr:lipase family protein [Candidatus Heimdallarchaeota archaeon]